MKNFKQRRFDFFFPQNYSGSTLCFGMFALHNCSMQKLSKFLWSASQTAEDTTPAKSRDN